METAEATAMTQWAIDPAHSEIGFTVKHLMITNVKGFFKEFEAEIHTNGEDFAHAEIAVRINTASVNTGDAQRDAHLRSADFFDTDQYPQMTFKSTRFEPAGQEGNFLMNGDLTIRGVTRPVKLDVVYEGMMKDPWGNRKAGFSLTGRINRKEWGLNWNAALEAGGMLVSEEVKINCEVQLAWK